MRARAPRYVSSPSPSNSPAEGSPERDPRDKRGAQILRASLCVGFRRSDDETEEGGAEEDGKEDGDRSFADTKMFAVPAMPTKRPTKMPSRRNRRHPMNLIPPLLIARS